MHGSVRKNCEGTLSKAADCDEWLATRVREPPQSRRQSSLYRSFELQEGSHGGAYDWVNNDRMAGWHSEAAGCMNPSEMDILVQSPNGALRKVRDAV